MPAIVVCAACQTKLKVPENSTAKALRCPKCKGAVPITPPKPPPPAEEEELEVNAAVDDEEELEVNEAADDEEELEVNEAADDDEENEDEEDETDKESALVELGFADVEDVFAEGNISDEARKAIEKTFMKKEKALWAGRPAAKIIESKAWIGLIAGPIAVLLGGGICVLTSSLSIFAISETMVKVIVGGIGVLFAVVFGGVGVVAVVFRKRIGGNVDASYVVTNKRAYIFDGSHHTRAFTPEQLLEMKAVESAQFPGAGDLIFGYDLLGDTGVQVDKETSQKFQGSGTQQSTAVGFLAIDNVKLVQQLINETLLEDLLDEIEAKKKRKKEKEKKRKRPFG